MADTPEQPRWKKFERLVYDIQREMAGAAEVRLNDSVVGSDTKTPRQLDVSIRQTVGTYALLIVLECRDLKNPVTVTDVEGFVSKLRDVRANKGAIISSRGFTKAAIKLAAHHAVDTFRLVDTRSTDWKSYVSIPALLERSRIRTFRLTFTGQMLPGRIIYEADLEVAQLYSQDGATLGTLRGMLARKWNAQEIDQEPGVHEVPLGTDLVLQLRDGPLTATVTTVVNVDREYYFGQLPIHLRGFKDEQTGGVLTRQFTTESIEPYAIEQGRGKGWRKIDDPSALAVQPLVRLSYSDVLPQRRMSETGRAATRQPEMP